MIEKQDIHDIHDIHDNKCKYMLLIIIWLCIINKIISQINKYISDNMHNEVVKNARLEEESPIKDVPLDQADEKETIEVVKAEDIQ